MEEEEGPQQIGLDEEAENPEVESTPPPNVNDTQQPQEEPPPEQGTEGPPQEPEEEHAQSVGLAELDETKPDTTVSAKKSEDNPFGVEMLQLPSQDQFFKDMRKSADELFDTKDVDEWLSEQIEPHVLEVGEVKMKKDVAEMEMEKTVKESVDRAKWDIEIDNKLEQSRLEVGHHQEKLRSSTVQIDWRLREEELAARERIVYEHRAMEADLLGKMRRRQGQLQHVPRDKFSWTVDWRLAPQEFSVNVSSLRGCRAKLRDGYFVFLLSVLDRVGGRFMRFSTGELNKDFCAPLPPLRFQSKSSEIDRYMNHSVNLSCPAPSLLRAHAVLLFEVWQLKVGKYDPEDRVVGWGVWPLVNKDYAVVEGKFKLPLLKGEMDSSVDTYRSITQVLQNSISYWLGNIYFEIQLFRAEHDVKFTADQFSINLNETKEYESTDQMRLEKTVEDVRSLTAPNLPPRLFFDNVATGSNSAIRKLRRRFFGTDDLRPLNASLWEKRGLLEEEKKTMTVETDRVRRASISEGEGDEEILELRIRKDLYSGTTMRKPKDLVFSEVDVKPRDSHVLLFNHHQAVASQREFFFLGRRYRDKAWIALDVLQFDLGINWGGPWDKTQVVVNVIFCIIGLLFRMIIHGAGLWLYLSFLDVPLTKNEWQVYQVDIRFEHTTRFRPSDSFVTMIIGTSACIFVFVVMGLAFFALLKVFQRLPYFLTRFGFWCGVAFFFDPPLTLLYESAQGDWESGDCFLLYNQLRKEEGSGVGGLFLTIFAYLGLMFIQLVLVYWYLCACHLNGRVNDVYDRLLFPETSFFMPHDLEISDTEFGEVIKKAKLWRSEAGDVKKVRVLELTHHYTCFFRARLFKLLSVYTNSPEDWVDEYIDNIPLRRPLHAEDLLEDNLGAYALGSDIADFMNRNFPHMTMMSSQRVGDNVEDLYYEHDLIRDMSNRSTPVEDNNEMRQILKAYFGAQVCGEKPVEWSREDPGVFILKDPALLADLIFFETSSHTLRTVKLAMRLRKFCEEGSYFSISPDEPSSFGKIKMPNFNSEFPTASMEGDEAQGCIIHIMLENPARGVKQLARSFVVTPFGTTIEPTSSSYSYLAEHTADDTEFWAAQGMKADRKVGEYVDDD